MLGGCSIYFSRGLPPDFFSHGIAITDMAFSKFQRTRCENTLLMKRKCKKKGIMPEEKNC
jgi:hypothetical protein